MRPTPTMWSPLRRSSVANAAWRGWALIGAAWGVGHTITVMVVGVAIIVFGIVIPPKLGLSMEFAVGIMLVLLGILTLTGMGRTVGAAHTHSHGGADGHALD